MTIKILAFGQISEITGTSDWTVENVQDTDHLRVLLEEQYPSLIGLKYSLAVNKEVTHQNTLLNQGDTIALLPPFSGG
ncbi:MAG: MoaD/ThiS family protein [Saprospiraceae bacterium]|jgi:molybdopterin synthase sulfur carrier subunit|nr:MoaD/ThiS family protein [Saprospiraceae bacterium]MBK8670107.1 MoaD/ThiS family protein [Saprospiraceae bacterium]MBL0102130.1 MoaD/ThiS family protein [Saprospiraceae bacterium]